MKIKVTDLPYETVKTLPVTAHKQPKRPNWFFRTLLDTVSRGELKETDFTWEEIGMEKLPKNQPALFLMNHSCFLDLKIVSHILRDRHFQIVCTSDGFVGKGWLMRQLGCIPTRKFQNDTQLVRDMLYALHKLNSSVLMYPEASYSFDGTATPLPESVGKCLKMLKVPVVMIRTYGAFAHDPLYNNLRQRKVRVTATVEYLLSAEDVRQKTVQELNDILAGQFSFDNFRWQQENKIRVTELFRADGLNRVLYTCPCCKTEGQMQGKDISLTCSACGAVWQLTELGALKAENREETFTHIPDWYAWQRQLVRQQLRQGEYRLDVPVEIYMQVDEKAIYHVGNGRLVHDNTGFDLTGCEGQLHVKQSARTSYGLYADYYWYEIGDMICIGEGKNLYYCFPKVPGYFVAKTRLATEELYDLIKVQNKKDPEPENA